MVVFIALVGGATAMLRRQVDEVSRAEAAWRTEAAWRRAMEDSLTVGLRARDTRGRLVYVNPAFCEQVGYSEAELVGRAPPMPYWPPDAVEESLSRMQRNLAGGAPREGYEARWLRRDGQAIDVMIFEARLVDALGRHIGWMGSTLDISERKRLAERERHQTEAAAAQARLTMLGEVASALAHQLNQPLTAIAGYNAGVLRSLTRDGYGNDIVLDAVRRLGEQAAEAGRIVQRIREFLTRRSPQREHCDLAAVAQRAVALLQRDIERQRVTLDWSIAAPLPLVLADPVLIEQVIINLLRNACDEMAGAGCAQPRIRIGLVASGDDFVRLDVDDAGPGLQGRRVEQLCAPFYSTKADGMGMGLAICRSVIEAHVGAFDAGPGVLGGARFSFTLPVAVAALTEAEELK
jgi:two-component system sensor histidine kinase DctS